MQASDTALINLDELLEFFGSTFDESDLGYTSASQKAVRSFAAYCTDNEVCSESEFGSKLRNWLVHFQLAGNTLTTCVRYLKALSGLYTKAVKNDIAPRIDVFKTLMASLRKHGNELWNANVTSEEFDRFIAFTKNASHNKREISLWSDMVIFSLLNGCMPLGEVARLKSATVFELGLESQDIVRRNKKEKFQYIFPLDQGNLTPKQLSATLTSIASGTLYKMGIKNTANPEEVFRSHWAYAALSAGFSPDLVRSYLGSVPAWMRILSLAQDTEFSEDEKKNLVTETASIFINNPMRWFAMHLRYKITFEALTGALDQLKEEIDTPELFYPSKEIARKIGKKRIFENQPIIRDIVYFKARVTSVRSLFYRIGDIAWCYKNDGINGSSYASIPESSFRRFQQTIGCFTPDFAEFFNNLQPLNKNDDIVVTGGLLNGYSGKLKKVITDTPDGIIRYIVEVWKEANSLIIEGDVDGRQVKKLTAPDKVEALGINS